MGRLRDNCNSHLPKGMSIKGSSYYVVSTTSPRRWIRLADNLDLALTKYNLIAGKTEGFEKLIPVSSDEYSIEKLMAANDDYIEAAIGISEKAILSNRTFAHIASGVYFLIFNSEIIYIGKSTNITSRIGSHAKSIVFDSYSVVQCSGEEMDEMEKVLIHKFKPKYNKNNVLTQNYCRKN